LRYHLSHKHPETLAQIEDDRRTKVRKTNNQETQQKITEFVTRSQVREHCLDIVVNCAAPFAVFDSPGMQALTQLASAQLHEKNTINSSNMKTTVLDKAKKLKAQLIEKLKGRFVNIQVDFATCQAQSFLGEFFEGLKPNRKNCLIETSKLTSNFSFRSKSSKSE
jgi:hypothetical protein